MNLMRQSGFIALLLAVSVGASGCATFKRTFHAPTKSAKETAAQGERISIVAFDDTVTPAEGLKGADFFLPDAQAVTQWSLPGGTLEQSMGNIQAGGKLSIAWKKGFGAKSGSVSHVTAPPVVADGKIYVMDGQVAISALNAKTGALIWKRNLHPKKKAEAQAFGGGLALADGKLVVSSGFRFVAELNADTGKMLWQTNTEQPVHAAPTIAGGRIFVVAVDNTLLTFDLATGAEGWTYQALSEPARILGASSPAVSGDTVVASFGSGELVALRTSNGNDLWNGALSRASRTNALSEIRDIPGRPVIYQGDVFAISHSGVFAATDLRTGQVRWNLPLTGITSPLPAGDVVYVIDKAGKVYCIARETGQAYWIQDLGEGRAKKTGLTLPSFGKAKPAKAAVEKRDADGKLRAKKIVRPIWSSPVLANGKLITASDTGEMVVINAKTGIVERSIKLGQAVTIAPIGVDGTLYVVTDEAQLIALR